MLISSVVKECHKLHFKGYFLKKKKLSIFCNTFYSCKQNALSLISFFSIWQTLIALGSSALCQMGSFYVLACGLKSAVIKLFMLLYSCSSASFIQVDSFTSLLANPKSSKGIMTIYMS